MSDPAIPARASVSAAGMRVVQLLAGKPPQTIFDLIKSTGLTRTAITEQLNDLVAAAGFVERTSQRFRAAAAPTPVLADHGRIGAAVRRQPAIGGPRDLGAIERLEARAGQPRSRPRQLDPGQALPKEHQRQGGAAQAVGQAPPRGRGPASRGDERRFARRAQAHARSSAYDESGASAPVDLQMMKQVVSARRRSDHLPARRIAVLRSRLCPINGRVNNAGSESTPRRRELFRTADGVFLDWSSST